MKKILLIGMSLAALLVAGSVISTQQVSARTDTAVPDYAQVLCGDGSASDDYGFTYPLEQYHWTVDGEAYLSQDTIDELDGIFDDLNNESVVQTMILFKPADEVGNRVNCAVHFLRYMQLGNADGERADNGFVFLFVVEEHAIDVHYGVGLGLPALTAHNLTDINRLAEDTYAETGSMDKAVLTMAYSFANYAREQYPPLSTGTAAYPTNNQNQAANNDYTSDQPTSITLPDFASMSITSLTCLCCISIIVLIVILLILSSLFRGGGRRGGWGGGGGFRPSGFGGGFSGWSGSSGHSSGGFRPSLPTRRGGGGGRSNRGN